MLLNAAGERFTDELQPRDVVSAAIFSMMEEEGSSHVWLSFAPVPEKTVTQHFKAIREECAKEGYDILKEPIPVVPAQALFHGRHSRGCVVAHEHAASVRRRGNSAERACAHEQIGRNELARGVCFRAAGGERDKRKRTGRKKRLRRTNRKGRAKQANRAVREEQIELAFAAFPHRQTHQRMPFAEDMNVGDISTDCVHAECMRRPCAAFVLSEDGIIAGLDVFARVFEILDSDACFEACVSDGDAFAKASFSAWCVGMCARAIISGERTALNYLQRMSGIATYTNKVAASRRQRHDAG